MVKIDYKSWNKEDLIKEVEQLRKRKKYGLVWEDKPEDVVEQCKTELPVLKEVKNKAIAKDKNGPVNILIEGDNYHALSVLNYTHKGKVDVIYIDPPYNTGNKDFIYNDDFVDAEDPYRHSKWLAFMEKRLLLAKNLLKRTGVIFISIDDNEHSRLKLLCDQIFLEKNFVQNFMWLHGKGKKDRWSRTLQQYVLCYARDKNKLPPWSILNYATYKFDNPDKDKRGGWFSGSISFSEERSNKQHPNYFEIKSPSGIVWRRQWQCSREEMDDLLKQKKIFFGLPPKYDAVPRVKIFPDDIDEQIPPNIIDSVESTREAQKKLDAMFGKKVFDYPKPVSLMKHLFKLSSKNDSVILDYMAGSGTTGQAVLELNKEDGNHRQFILCTDNQDNNGSGIKIATDICYPRVAKVIEGYKDAKGKKVDGIKSNLKYFRTAFLGAEPSDKNKEALTKQATEMLCMREDTFEPVKETAVVKIFKNPKQHTGIVFDEDAIPALKKDIARIGGVWSVYIFSLGDDTFEDEFEGIKQKITVAPIPEAILRVYRRLFKP